MVLVNRRTIVIIATIKKGAKMVSPCSSLGFEKSTTHSVAPWTATELNMRAGGERQRNGRGERRKEIRPVGAKSLCLSSRKVTCEHSAGERDL